MKKERTPASDENKTQKDSPVKSVVKNLTKNPYVTTAGTLFIIVTVVAALLAIVNMSTEPLIDQSTREENSKARGYVLPEATEFIELEPPSAEQVISLLEGRSGGVVKGYVCEVKTLGYKGYFSIMVGVDTEGAVTGVSIITPTQETPGVGTGTEDPAWLSQFKGKTDAWVLQMDGGDIEAVSGATVSSRAVVNGVATAVSAVLEVTRGGGAS